MRKFVQIFHRFYYSVLKPDPCSLRLDPDPCSEAGSGYVFSVAGSGSRRIGSNTGRNVLTNSGQKRETVTRK